MPTNDASYMRDFMRRYRAAGKESSRRPDATRPFVAIDGEGGSAKGSKYHSYFLLTAGQSKLLPSSGNVRLTSRECLDFISRLDPGAVYVAYFFDYDVTKICEDIPWPKLNRLIHRGLRSRLDGFGTFPVTYDEFELDYLPRKEFRVRRILPQSDRCPFCDEGRTYDDISCDHAKPKPQYSPWIILNDVGSFFQCPFVDALEKWKIGTAEQREAIREGKKKRNEFTIEEIDDISDYNDLEIILLAELMEKFRDVCKQVGYVPARWQGPGLLAEAMLRAHGVPASKDVALLQDKRYADLLRYASNAFYGGRPELGVIGPVNRPCYQSDINSAYPYAMQYVPCLQHGTWKYEKDIDIESLDTPKGKVGEKYALCYGSFNWRTQRGDVREKRPLFFGLPIRGDDGTILYPASGRGWYWSFEIVSSIHQTFSVSGAWTYTRTCQCAPLGFVADVYAYRLRVGKDDAGIILKLGLNSIFGKTCQSVGSPKYANPIWASFITAYCRMMIQEFIHGSPYCTDPTKRCGEDILMIATDSVASTTERSDVVYGKGLGAWTVEVHPRGMFFIQPGLYFGSSGKHAKTRGVPLSAVETREQEFRDNFDKLASSGDLARGDVVIPQRIFCGIRYALHRRNTSLLGQWISFDENGRGGKVVRFDWASKRQAYPALPPMPANGRDWITTYPQEGSVSIETLPYSRNIGGLISREQERLAFVDNPDWADTIDVGEMQDA